MDIEQLNELESILYASIHYNDATSGQQQHTLAADVDVDAQNMPPPQQQIEQQQQQQNQQQKQQHRFVSNKRIINNATAKPRYWADNNTETAAINDNWTSKSKGTAESKFNFGFHIPTYLHSYICLYCDINVSDCADKSSLHMYVYSYVYRYILCIFVY